MLGWKFLVFLRKQWKLSFGILIWVHSLCMYISMKVAACTTHPYMQPCVRFPFMTTENRLDDMKFELNYLSLTLSFYMPCIVNLFWNKKIVRLFLKINSNMW